MTDPEQDLATILDALKATEPPSGLTRRIVDNLTAHQVASAASAHRWLPSLSLRPLARTLLNRRSLTPLGLAAILASVLVFLHQHHPATKAKPAVTVANPAVARANPAVARANPAVARANPAVARANPAVARANPAVARANPAVARANPAVARAKPAVAQSAVISSAAATSPSDAPGNPCCHSDPELVEAEEPPHFALNHAAKRRAHLQPATLHPNHLASFPAPPLPLTPQEKLLLRVAQAQNPQQSPVLNPALRASVAAHDDENFQIFFAPATTIKPYEPSI